MAQKKAFNPFYFLLVITGTVFCLTACAYMVMTVRGRQPEIEPTGQGLIGFMDTHGFSLLLWELVLLAVFTFAAMGTDSFWEKRTTRASEENESSE
ncbi:MAG: hypothetical protein AAGF97_11075 [Planctomycetota bacterium]